MCSMLIFYAFVEGYILRLTLFLLCRDHNTRWANLQLASP